MKDPDKTDAGEEEKIWTQNTVIEEKLVPATGEIEKKFRRTATKKTQERVGILLQCLSEGMPIKRACEFAMIHKDTYYDWYKTDESFRLKAHYAISKAIRELVHDVKKKDPWKILKNIDAEHFKEHVEVRVSEEMTEVVTADGTKETI